jgi:hypothetical protein
LAADATPSAVASGPDAPATRPPTAPDQRSILATRRTFLALTALGLTPEEASNLTAFMCGIPVDGAHWSIRQINDLLFLRELRRTGRFGRADGRSPRPH